MSAPRCFLPDTSVEMSLWFIFWVLHRITGKKSCVLRGFGGRNAWSFNIKEMAPGLCFFILRLRKNPPPQEYDTCTVWSPTHVPKGQEPHPCSFRCSTQVGRKEKKRWNKGRGTKGREGEKNGGKKESKRNKKEFTFSYSSFIWHLSTLLSTVIGPSQLATTSPLYWKGRCCMLAVYWVSRIFCNKNKSVHLFNCMSGILGTQFMYFHLMLTTLNR